MRILRFGPYVNHSPARDSLLQLVDKPLDYPAGFIRYIDPTRCAKSLPTSLIDCSPPAWVVLGTNRSEALKYLWSPWRMSYIENHLKEENCVFCLAAASPDDQDSLVVARGQRAFIILNRFPYTSGHLMAVPYEHCSGLEQLDPETRAEIMELTNRATLVLQDVYHPQGFNLGMNIGAAAGAGIAEHIHLHVVPRWGGDTNFMTSLADTRVLPESLEDTYRRVRAAWTAQIRQK